MKQKTILLLALFMLVSLALAACDIVDTPSVPMPTPESTPEPAPVATEAPIPEPTPIVTEAPAPEPAVLEQAVSEGVDIIGTWFYMMTIFGDAETQGRIDELSAAQIEIRGDNTLVAVFHSTIEGVLVPNGRYEFLLTEQVAVGEGQQWHPEDVTLQFDPSSGSLRWTLFNPYSEEYVHHYFDRARG